jgi:hypothetical protein
VSRVRAARRFRSVLRALRARRAGARALDTAPLRHRSASICPFLLITKQAERAGRSRRLEGAKQPLQGVEVVCGFGGAHSDWKGALLSRTEGLWIKVLCAFKAFKAFKAFRRAGALLPRGFQPQYVDGLNAICGRIECYMWTD